MILVLYTLFQVDIPYDLLCKKSPKERSQELSQNVHRRTFVLQLELNAPRPQIVHF
jgi:hypothetical protein